MEWDAPLKPNELCEQRLIAAILDSHFPIDSTLPGERDLAEQLGVTRPTLRETLQRLARDGWLDIQQGKPTRVRNYWEEGNLAVLDAIARFPQQQPEDFVPNLLYIRQLMAPAYARLAVERNAETIQALIKEYIDLPEDAETFASADWDLHRQLTICSGNPVFTLILNGFRDLYPLMGQRYFQFSEARARSRQFYADLHICARVGDGAQAELVTKQMMAESLQIWQLIAQNVPA